MQNINGKEIKPRKEPRCDSCGQAITRYHWGAGLFDRLTLTPVGNYHHGRSCIEPILYLVRGTLPGQLWWCGEENEAA